jgi:hypothetical protein
MEHRKIIDYVVITGDDEDELRTHVSAALDAGYEPIGGVAIRGDGVLYQAMIEYRKQP